MMSSEWLAALARYNRWMNDKLCALAATLSDEERKRDGGAFFKSIHGTLNHRLVADRVWLSRFKGVPVELRAHRSPALVAPLRRSVADVSPTPRRMSATFGHFRRYGVC
jgi:uncharacterized damage-inducible protein DinB